MWCIKLDKELELNNPVRKSHFINRKESKVLSRGMVENVFEIMNLYKMNDNVYCFETDKKVGVIHQIKYPRSNYLSETRFNPRPVKKVPAIEIKLMSLKEMELLLIKKVLEYTKGNQTQASKILKCDVKTIRRNLKG